MGRGKRKHQPDQHCTAGAVSTPHRLGLKGFRGLSSSIVEVSAASNGGSIGEDGALRTGDRPAPAPALEVAHRPDPADGVVIIGLYRWSVRHPPQATGSVGGDRKPRVWGKAASRGGCERTAKASAQPAESES